MERDSSRNDPMRICINSMQIGNEPATTCNACSLFLAQMRGERARGKRQLAMLAIRTLQSMPQFVHAVRPARPPTLAASAAPRAFAGARTPRSALGRWPARGDYPPVTRMALQPRTATGAQMPRCAGPAGGQCQWGNQDGAPRARGRMRRGRGLARPILGAQRQPARAAERREGPPIRAPAGQGARESPPAGDHRAR